VNIINLPPVLPGELDLRDLNLQLQTGEVTLDWSNVQDAPESALAILLAGLDIVEQSQAPHS